MSFKSNLTARSAAMALAAAAGMMPVFAAESDTAAQALSPAEIQEAEEKGQKITFLQDDAQFNMVSRIYTLKHTKAADIAPFVKSAVLRFDGVSTVGRLEDQANGRQMLIVTTAQDMMPYVDEMVAALDRPGKMNSSESAVAGSGIAYGVYKPQFRAAAGMRRIIVNGQVASSTEDARVRLDKKTNMFYFKDTPYRVEEIKRKLEWLDREIPQTRIELKIYEVRDSDLKDIGIDYLAWKNGPGLNLFSAAYDALNMKAAETLVSTGVDLFGNFSYGFGGFYTAPAFDFSFIRLLQQTGKAVINSTAALTVSNVPGKVFQVSFSPEYQNIVKDEDHRSSVEVGGNAALEFAVTDTVVTGGKDGVVNFSYVLAGSNAVERNNMGVEIMENTRTGASVALNFGEEKLLASWKRSSEVEQTVGVPFLCELPVLKYIFGTTTSNTETVHYFVTAKAVPVQLCEDVKSGVMAEFDELAGK